MAVRWREQRQEGERLLAEIAETASNADPIVVLVMSLLAAAAMADNRIAQTNWASPQNLFHACFGPIGFEAVLGGRKCDKKNRGKSGSAFLCDRDPEPRRTRRLCFLRIRLE